MQTVVCIPLLDGVVELGTTEWVQEDVALIQHIKSFFTDPPPPHPSKPALSEQSTSNPATSLHRPPFHSSPIPAIYAAVDPPVNANEEDEDEDEEEEEEEEDDEEGHQSNSEAETARNSRQATADQITLAAAGPIELMQLELSEDIRFGSPDDGSNNLDSDFHLLAWSHGMNNPADQQQETDTFRGDSSRKWSMSQERVMNGAPTQQPPSGDRKINK